MDDFVGWLQQQKWRRDAIGDLSRDTRRDPGWPPSGKVTRARLRAYLEQRDAIPAALAALDAAWDEWDAARRDAKRN